jgi:acylphosphatase
MAKAIYYTGQVQGVGFRATAARIARLHPVRGWVRNLADGRVELFVDGPLEAIEAFLADLRKRMAECIETAEVVEREPDAMLDGFRIVY